MADRILEFYFYCAGLSLLSSIITYNIYLPKIGLDTNPNETNSAGLKPFANPITIIDNYIRGETLGEKSVRNLKRLRNWFQLNLTLFAVIPIVVILQILVSNSLR